MPKMSQFDFDQIQKMVYDEEANANRVTIVGADIKLEPKINIPPIQISPMQGQIQKEIQIERIEVPVIIKEQEIKVVEVPKVIVETKIKELPVDRIIVQEKFHKVEVPVVVHDIQVKEIEKPVIVERFREDKVLKAFQIIQSLAVFGILIKMLMK